MNIQRKLELFLLGSSVTLFALGCGGNVSYSATSKTGATPVSAPLYVISIAGASPISSLGQTLQLHASESTGTATPTDVTAVATWQVYPAGSLTVAAGGLVTCVAAGTAQISASKDGAVNSVSITCSPAPAPTTLAVTGAANLTAVGQTLQLHASEASGATAAVDVTASAVWQVSPGSSFSINASGLVTCLAGGTATVTASKDGASATALLTCSVAVVAVSTYPTIGISGSTTLLGLGATSQLSASESLSSTASSDVTASVTWKSSSSGLLPVSAAGIATCLNIGSATISASKGGLSASTVVTCSLGSSSLTLSRQSMSLRVGAPASVAASGASPGNAPVDVSQSAAWSPGSSIATVDNTGLVSCIRDGAGTVTATLGALTQTIPLTCSPSSWNTPSYFAEQSDEFVGPLAGWVNVKTQFGAVGDGHTDDTAAIQAALDSLTNTSKCVVLWFPAGHYAVKELQILQGFSFTVVGSDPQTTELDYIGPAGGTMLQVAGGDFFRISRLSFNGNQRADIAEEITDAPGGSYNTFNEISDEHIFGVNKGIALTDDDETTIERVFFDNLPVFGVQVGNFNVLNIFITDCLFLNNGTGVTNVPLAGSFIVSNSFFSHSIVADMSIGNTVYFTSRHNTSVGSNAFFVSGGIGANPAQITIQNNTVLDPVVIPFQLGNQGPLMLIDNVVRTRNPDLPAISAVADDTVSRSVFSFGNTYTTGLPPISGRNLPLDGVYTSYDDSIADVSSIPDVKIPSNVYVPPNRNRQIFEVAVNASDLDIQKQINLAVSSGTPSPVIHIPWGTYRIASTITVPAGSDLQIIGDDSHATALWWQGAANGPVLKVNSSTVAMRGFRVVQDAGPTVDGIRISVLDQPSTQVIVDQAQLQFGNAVSVRFEGIEHATAELHSTYVLGTVTGVDAIGGTFRAAHVGALGVTNYYSGSAQSTGNSTSFNVSLGGKLLIQDNWHDYGATSPRNFILSGSGTLTEQVGAAYMSSDTPFEIDDFDGRVSLIGLMFTGGFLTHPGKGTTNLLTLGLDGSTDAYQPQPSNNLVVANILNEYYDAGGHQIPSGPPPDLKWLRGMFAQTRSQYPRPRLPLAPGASRLRINRIEAQNMSVGLHIIPSSSPQKLFYNLISGGSALTTGVKGTGACATSPATVSPNPLAWSLMEAGDGDYILLDSTGMNALGVSAVGQTVVLAPLDSEYDQRWIIEDVGDGRKTVQSRSSPGVLAWQIGACPQIVADRTAESAKWTFIAN